MKSLTAFAACISIYVVSYYSMVNGWGLEPVNMGWVVCGYLWVFLAGGIVGLINND